MIMFPEDHKTDEDKEQEERLLQQKVDLVNQRSLIVDCQDEDRIRSAHRTPHDSVSLPSTHTYIVLCSSLSFIKLG